MSLYITAKGNDQKYRIIVIFGAGLIGTAIAGGLLSFGKSSQIQVPYDWHTPENQKKQLNTIEKNITEFLQSYPVSATHIVWSAGKAGFNSNEQETDIELENYLRVMTFARGLSDRLYNNFVVYHTVSSAGGLFEGQRLVTSETCPTPKRPYGWLKVKQENALNELDHIETFKKRIYRPSSVYTYIIPGQRLGLITTLIINGVRKNVSYITGSLTTIRDYVFAPDIGKYFAKKLMEEDYSEYLKIIPLVSGKPTSIHEIKKIVENTINSKLYVNYSLNKSNEENISFSRSLIPKNFDNTDMHTTIMMIFNKFTKVGAPFETVKYSER